MNARHTEERREMFMGEEIVYYVTVLDDPIPAPTAEVAPTPEAARRLDCTAPARLQTPARPARSVRPTKSEFVSAFLLDFRPAFDGPLPGCVRETVRNAERRVLQVRDDFAPDRLPRRLRRAIARFYRGSFAERYYDAGTLARIDHYHLDTRRRAYLSKMTV